jgi:hypothetical protein
LNTKKWRLRNVTAEIYVRLLKSLINFLDLCSLTVGIYLIQLISKKGQVKKWKRLIWYNNVVFYEKLYTDIVASLGCFFIILRLKRKYSTNLKKWTLLHIFCLWSNVIHTDQSFAKKKYLFFWCRSWAGFSPALSCLVSLHSFLS